jgi:hypothetical protein
MRLIIILSSVFLFSFSAFSKVELYCELYDSGKASTRTQTINQRIQVLEKAGYNVSISHLTSAIGGANNTAAAGSGRTRTQLDGRIRHEKCASLVYKMNGPR